MAPRAARLRTLTLTLAASIALGGCVCSSTDTSQTKLVPVLTDIDAGPSTDIPRLLKQLRDPNLDRREDALQRIHAVAKVGLTPNDVSALIKTATLDYPPTRFELTSYAEELLSSTREHLRDSHVKELAAAYPKLAGRARPAALATLAQLGSSTATDQYVKLLQRHGWPKPAFPAVVLPFEREPRFPDVIIPAFTDGTVADVPTDVRWRVVLAYASRSAIPDDLLRSLRPAAAGDANAAIARALPFQRVDGIAWRWDDAYADVRIESGLLLDVLGHLGPSADVLQTLRHAQSLADPYLATFAAASLARLDEQPVQQALNRAAGDPETRNLLFDLLSDSGNRSLFPPDQMRQEKLAESDMVRWLVFPTELARAPDEIELMESVELDLGGSAGVFTYYIFRFRTHAPHGSLEQGWMAGVSGPFAQKDFPTTDSWGDTFSTFTKWEDFAPEEHLSSIQDLMQRWREHHANEE